MSELGRCSLWQLLWLVRVLYQCLSLSLSQRTVQKLLYVCRREGKPLDGDFHAQIHKGLVANACTSQKFSLFLVQSSVIIVVCLFLICNCQHLGWSLGPYARECPPAELCPQPLIFGILGRHCTTEPHLQPLSDLLGKWI